MEGVNGPCTISSEKRTSGSQIRHSKPTVVKVDRTRVFYGKLANGKKRMNYPRSHKDFGETKGPESPQR
jgi:hypothetical protein